MSQPKPARPSQVTVAGWLVVAGSIVVVLMAFSQVSDLRSLETREAVEEYLSKPPGDAFGLGVQGALSLMRIAAMIAAACAAATAILGWHVLQRSKGARVALSALALPLFVTGLVSGGIASGVVAAAIVMLWFQPARDWFNGITRAPEPKPLAPPPTPPELPREAPPEAPREASREPVGRDPLLDLPPPSGPPLHPTPYAAGVSRPAAAIAEVTRRPPAATWACVLTWSSTITIFCFLALVVVVMIVAPDAVLEEAHRQNPDLEEQGVTDAALRTASFVTCGLVMVWTAAAAAFALLTWRGVGWARLALLASAAIAGCLCLLAMIGSLILLVPLASCAATVALLLRPEARAWVGRAAPRRQG